MTKMKVALLALVSLMVLGLASCDLFGLGVVGKWQFDPAPENKLEFTLDGKVIFSLGSLSATGTYTKTDTTLIYTIDGDTSPTFTYTVDATTLKFSNDGTVSTYTRIK